MDSVHPALIPRQPTSQSQRNSQLLRQKLGVKLYILTSGDQLRSKPHPTIITTSLLLMTSHVIQ
jgi:hypothetical protein